MEPKACGLMLAELLPPDVVAVDIIGDDPDVHLLPEEQHLVAKAVEKRRREVTSARTCARRALTRLGIAAAPILKGPKGEPLWPAGVVGSITHTTGYYAAAVAYASKIRSIGVDAEVHGVLPDGVLGHVAYGPELDWLAGRDHSTVWWDRLLFSAKESVYKAWFPLTGRWLGFEDAMITIDPDDHTFHAKILVDGTTHTGAPLAAMSGRWLVRDGLVLTAITVPND
ncbi:MAG TPA: 4'-phosphopantetheinyl transferase superfamily protein [Pseudonocardiaceae bacterium]|nr:4'-phosphopantetheinyl transferase superfamily protein [Pseudonocardiaceae bacterium]